MVKQRHRGFTLIELSIVLVIISLIIAGIFVGEDLIHAALVRAQIAQIDQYKVAVETFRGKYKGLPGDLRYNDASAFGLFAFSGPDAGAEGFGNGNGHIQSCIPITPVACPGAGTLIYVCLAGIEYECGETMAFWRHLSESGFVDGSYGRTLNASSGVPGANILLKNLATMLPPAKLGQGTFIRLSDYGEYTDNRVDGSHYLYMSKSWIAAGVDISIRDTGYSGWLPSVNAQDAYAIDSKVDDGMPEAGNVRSWGFSPNCVISDGDNVGADGIYRISGIPTPCTMYFRI